MSIIGPKIEFFGGVVPGLVLERLFVDFGTHFGSLLAPKWLKKAHKNRHSFWDRFRGVTDALWG